MIAECNSAASRTSTVDRGRHDRPADARQARGATTPSEVRRLLDAGLEVMRALRHDVAARGSPTSSPRPASRTTPSTATSPSKDALVAAILEDGTERLRSYLAHQMAKAPTPERPRCGAGSRASWRRRPTTTSRRRPSPCCGTAASLSERLGPRRSSPAASLAPLLRDPFAELGSPDPDADASLAAHAAVGRLSDLLWQRVRPTRAEIDRIAEFCLAAVTARAQPARRRAR